MWKISVIIRIIKVTPVSFSAANFDLFSCECDNFTPTLLH